MKKEEPSDSEPEQDRQLNFEMAQRDLEYEYSRTIRATQKASNFVMYAKTAAILKKTVSEAKKELAEHRANPTSFFTVTVPVTEEAIEDCESKHVVRIDIPNHIPGSAYFMGNEPQFSALCLLNNQIAGLTQLVLAVLPQLKWCPKIARELSGVITDVVIKTNSITDREEIQPRDGSDEFYTQLPDWDLGWNDDLYLEEFN